jgi:hypothetical protein
MKIYLLNIYLSCLRYFRGGDEISPQILNKTDDIKTQKCSVIVIPYPSGVVEYGTGEVCKTGHIIMFKVILRKTGDRKTANRKTGDRKTANRKTGDRKTGDRKTANRKTGDRKTANRKTGDRKTANRKTGERQDRRQEDRRQEERPQEDGQKEHRRQQRCGTVTLFYDSGFGSDF